MKPLTLRLRTAPPCRVDASPLAPATLAGKSRPEIERIALQGWNASFRVGDLFAVRSGDPGRLVLQDVDGSFLRIGAGLAGGEIVAIGRSGDSTGEAMTGGAIHVRGNAGDFLGAAMSGGTIACTGDAGLFAGSARNGEMTGMRGGVLVVRGRAGDRAGDRMRRGLLLVEGGVGDYCAARMLAGTIVALGTVGRHPGYLLQRGSVLLGPRDAELGPTFNHSGDYDLIAIRLLLRSLARHGGAFVGLSKRARALPRWVGDLGAAGKGEIFLGLA